LRIFVCHELLSCPCLLNQETEKYQLTTVRNTIETNITQPLPRHLEVRNAILILVMHGQLTGPNVV